MLLTNSDPLLTQTLQERRQKLANLIDFPAILWSGESLSRNYPALKYPFRPSSHFLYFAGLPLENAAIRLANGRLELFMDETDPQKILWHGDTLNPTKIAEKIAADSLFPLSELASYSQGAATISVQDFKTQQTQHQILNRPIFSSSSPQGIDSLLTQAIISLRLTHDDLALRELKTACKITILAHQAGMKATLTASKEAHIRSAMEAVLMSENMTVAYPSIVTKHGEILHNESYFNSLHPGDLILADVGGETPLGWAADLTRTWPVSGKFSPSQREIYELVLKTHDTCIAHLKPGIEYLDIHILAARIFTEGLIDLGLLRGHVDDLINRDAHALFFPHGIGHLVGLDVHDMEDLGDRAGYALGRVRSQRFGLCYLRLNRVLHPGMLVTIEPGFYQIPAILNHPDHRRKYQDCVHWEQLEKFADVRGIRIEDDVLITPTGHEVLSQSLLHSPHDIEAFLT